MLWCAVCMWWPYSIWDATTNLIVETGPGPGPGQWKDAKSKVLSGRVECQR